MPIQYEIDQENRLILEVWTGDIHLSDLEAYWRDYMSDPRVMKIRRTLVDLRKCNIHFKGPDFGILIRTVVAPLLKGQDWTTAIVVDDPHQIGVSRQYQVFAEQYSKDNIFHNVEDARTWLIRDAKNDSTQNRDG